MQKIHITHFSNAWPFVDSVNLLMAALGELGLDVSYEPKNAVPGRLNIVLSSHYTSCDVLLGKVQDVILYNQDHISPLQDFINRQHFFRLLKRCWVWDYSPGNMERLNQAGIYHARYMPIGYAGALRTLQPAVAKDIDVLFYGNGSAYRDRVLELLRKAGLAVTLYQNPNPSNLIFDEHTHDRNRLIERSKVVLNLHNSEHPDRQNLEIARLSFPLTNGVPVVTEIAAGTSMDPALRAMLRGGDAEALPGILQQLLHNDAEREQYGQEASAEFARTFHQSRWLQQGLEDYWRARPHSVVAGGRLLAGAAAEKAAPYTPRIMCLGWNADTWSFDALQADAHTRQRPDLVLDMYQPLPENRTFSSWRFDQVQLPDGSLDTIRIESGMECQTDIGQLLRNALNLLRDAGTLELVVPYDLSLGAWKNPDAVRAFNEKTWQSLIDTKEYLDEGSTCCFDMTAIVWIAGELYNQLRAQGMGHDDLLRTPRAMEALRIHLRKRPLTDAERRQARQDQSGAGDSVLFPCEQAYG